jgi:hypothetical protein
MAVQTIDAALEALTCEVEAQADVAKAFEDKTTVQAAFIKDGLDLDKEQ